MAIASINLTCETCGKEFVHRRECRNRADANQYESWARANICLCADCRRKQDNDADAAKAESILREHGLTMPEIAGVSNKQVAYARSLRDKRIIRAGNLDAYKRYIDLTARIESDPDTRAEVTKVASDNDMTLDEFLAGARKTYRIDVLFQLGNISSAREIIDLLR